MDSLKVTDEASAAVATAPRVSLADIQAAIKHRIYFRGDALDSAPELKTFTLCILIMQNGFIVVGKAAPASPENFDAELGSKLAYEDAVRQVWPLMGYALREKLHG